MFKDRNVLDKRDTLEKRGRLLVIENRKRKRRILCITKNILLRFLNLTSFQKIYAENETKQKRN